jgi:vanillate O-demethylase monooxygenase subunit
MSDLREFLRNCWYVFAVTEELAENQMLSRTILGEPIIVFRNPQDEWSAMSDRCPHRFAPLSRGDLTDGIVTCAYHGLAFDASGLCKHNPHGPVSKALTIRTYPVRLEGPLLWIWMGDKELTSVTPVPAYDWSYDGSHYIGMGYIHGLAHYELMSDNILDLSHIEYLHPLLGSDAVSKAKVHVDSSEDRVVTTRSMKSEYLSAPLARTYRTNGAPVDRDLRVEWRAPALMELTVTVTPLVPEGAPARGSRTLHLFTPETPNSTHYFYVCGMDRETTPPEIADGFRGALEKVFIMEDKPMIDAQQGRIGLGVDIMDLKPAMLAIDRAPVLARRILKSQIQAEVTPEPA